jgi:hypothetical protein
MGKYFALTLDCISEPSRQSLVLRYVDVNTDEGKATENFAEFNIV